MKICTLVGFAMYNLDKTHFLKISKLKKKIYFFLKLQFFLKTQNFQKKKNLFKKLKFSEKSKFSKCHIPTTPIFIYEIALFSTKALCFDW